MDAAERIRRVVPLGGTRSFRSLSRSLRLSYDDIEDAIHDAAGLDHIVGMRCGGGYSEFTHRGDHEVEHYEQAPPSPSPDQR